LTKNCASLGYDLKGLTASRRLFLDYVHVERSEIQETGEYDLEGLFIRLDHAIKSIGAKRVVLDTLESLFAGLPNPFILRAELRRLFRWLKTNGMTAVITGEQGTDSLTRQGLEEYVSDCVVALSHRVSNQISTRRLRIVKYRGSSHGANEYPFLICETGLTVLPITSLRLEHAVSRERVSSGIPRLDSMLGGKGYFRGTTVLVSGTAGTGKTSVAAAFADAACRRGEKCVYFSFEESSSQVVRNMRSIGINLQDSLDKGLLRFHAERPTMYGLEAHLASVHEAIDEFKPKVVIIDPISNLLSVGVESDIKTMLTRIIDYLKVQRITTLFTSLTTPGDVLERTEVGISSLADTWLILRDIELGGERNRAMYILKARGIAHSNQIREFLMTSHGIDLVDAYVGPAGVLTGAARLSQEAQEKDREYIRRHELELKRINLESKRRAVEAQVAALRGQFEAEEKEVKSLIAQEEMRIKGATRLRRNMARMRKAD
jgi:circadian clock protein KaiC